MVLMKENNSPLGDRIRRIADQLQAETTQQIKATSKILGAAAQINLNHEKLIDEVVDVMHEDLTERDSHQATSPLTSDVLKQKFKTLRQAKDYFQIKAQSWDALAQKLKKKRRVEIDQFCSQKSVILPHSHFIPPIFKGSDSSNIMISDLESSLMERFNLIEKRLCELSEAVHQISLILHNKL